MPARERRFALQAWLVAPLAAVGLRLGGLQPVLDLIDGLPNDPRDRKHGEAREPSPPEAEHLVRMAFRLHPLLRGGCLERSVVQYLLHRWRRTPVRLVVGVCHAERSNDTRIRAHAWVEAPGTVATTQFAPLYTRETAA